MKTFDAVKLKHRVTLQLSAGDHDRSFMRSLLEEERSRTKVVTGEEQQIIIYGRNGGAMLLIIVTKHIV